MVSVLASWQLVMAGIHQLGSMLHRGQDCECQARLTYLEETSCWSAHTVGSMQLESEAQTQLGLVVNNHQIDQLVVDLCPTGVCQLGVTDQRRVY